MDTPRTSAAATVPTPPVTSSRRGLLSLLLAGSIVAAAWVIGDRQGFASIGLGGVNQSLLPKVGSPAPDIATLLSDGRLVKLSDFLGQPVWLNFWGSWCPPCRSEMPDMEAAYQQLAPQGLVMLAISLDEPPDTAFVYAARNGATYLVGTDPARKLTGAAYPIINFPTHVLIDREGIIQSIILAELDTAQFVSGAAVILTDGSDA